MPTTITITVTPQPGEPFQVQGTLTTQQTDWLIVALQRGIDDDPIPPISELYERWIKQCHRDQVLRGRKYSQSDPGEIMP